MELSHAVCRKFLRIYYSYIEQGFLISSEYFRQPEFRDCRGLDALCHVNCIDITELHDVFQLLLFPFLSYEGSRYIGILS